MNADFDRRMRDFYSYVDGAIASHRPACVNRGTCCKFAKFGHKLYVTAVELRFFVARQRANGLHPVENDAACPYQVGGMCTARDHRPLGCRVFFCDPSAKEWQPIEYESGLAELKEIGREFQIEYRYQEWLSALREASRMKLTCRPRNR